MKIMKQAFEMGIYRFQNGKYFKKNKKRIVDKDVVNKFYHMTSLLFSG